MRKSFASSLPWVLLCPLSALTGCLAPETITVKEASENLAPSIEASENLEGGVLADLFADRVVVDGGSPNATINLAAVQGSSVSLEGYVRWSSNHPAIDLSACDQGRDAVCVVIAGPVTALQPVTVSVSYGSTTISKVIQVRPLAPTGAAPTRLAFVAQPAAAGTVNAALATQPVLALQDGSGQTATSSSGQVQLRAYRDAACTVQATGVLSASVNPLTTSQGRAAFSGVRYSAAETIYLRATASGLLPACSRAIQVSTAPVAARLKEVVTDREGNVVRKDQAIRFTAVPETAGTIAETGLITWFSQNAAIDVSVCNAAKLRVCAVSVQADRVSQDVSFQVTATLNAGRSGSQASSVLVNLKNSATPGTSVIGITADRIQVKEYEQVTLTASLHSTDASVSPDQVEVNWQSTTAPNIYNAQFTALDVSGCRRRTCIIPVGAMAQSRTDRIFTISASVSGVAAPQPLPIEVRKAFRVVLKDSSGAELPVVRANLTGPATYVLGLGRTARIEPQGVGSLRSVNVSTSCGSCYYAPGNCVIQMSCTDGYQVTAAQSGGASKITATLSDSVTASTVDQFEVDVLVVSQPPSAGDHRVDSVRLSPGAVQFARNGETAQLVAAAFDGTTRLNDVPFTWSISHPDGTHAASLRSPSTLGSTNTVVAAAAPFDLKCSIVTITVGGEYTQSGSALSAESTVCVRRETGGTGGGSSGICARTPADTPKVAPGECPELMQ